MEFVCQALENRTLLSGNSFSNRAAKVVGNLIPNAVAQAVAVQTDGRIDVVTGIAGSF